mgnify:CR=1 FL=1
MSRLFLTFGYAGILPFALFTAMIVFGGDAARSVTNLQIAYAGMILSFLAGVHWGQALTAGNAKQISFSMAPTIISLCLFLINIIGYSFPALIGTAFMFLILFEADKRFLVQELLPPGYFRFRRNLTWIVAALLITSAIAVY